MLHVLTKELAELRGRIEQEFFRIERESRWMSAAINGLIAGTAVGLIAWLVSAMEASAEGNLLLFACLGSSSAAVVFAPVAKTNSLRSIMLAYLSSCLVCVVLFSLREKAFFSVPLQCFMAVALSISLMRVLDAMHPAAVGSAMAFIIYNRDVRSLVLLLLAIIGLLTIVKVLAYIYLEELEFRQFPREFRRAYYGIEMTLTVEPDGPNDQDVAIEQTHGV